VAPTPPVELTLAERVTIEAPPAAPDASLEETMQFVRPTDEAVQLLPARLEVVSGMTPQQVIRFVRVPGKPAEMILGREVASSPQQVTLTSSTVSRRHARVTYDHGRWLVSNLSRTNPVVVNDHALEEFEGPRPLLDGDRIELGDVVLRFCTS
jgi:pSer/pThr/pTyr-binding forkhead associated (FHA) protein